MPVHVVDDTGTLLLSAEAVATRDPRPVVDGDVLQKILRGRELPRTGPTTVPTLRPLPVPLPVPEPEVTFRNAPEKADAPSGSALSAVDMTTLFAPTSPPVVAKTAATAARGRHVQ